MILLRKEEWVFRQGGPRRNTRIAAAQSSRSAVAAAPTATTL